MNALRRFSTLFLASMFAFALIPVSAQDDEEAGPLDDLSVLEGIEAGVSRSWSVDFTAMMQITPEDPEADPFADLEGVFFLTAIAMQFDDNDNAAAAFEIYRDVGLDEIETSFEGGEEVEVSQGEIDDLGDQAHGIDVHSIDEESEGFFRYAFAQDDEHLFVTISVATSAEATAGADSLLDHLVNDGEASDDDVEFVAEGGSTGGLWGIFPDDDHEALEGLIAGGDEILFPIPEEEAP